MYDNLFLDPEPEAGDKDFLTLLNPNSLEILTGWQGGAGLTGRAGAPVVPVYAFRVFLS